MFGIERFGHGLFPLCGGVVEAAGFEMKAYVNTICATRPVFDHLVKIDECRVDGREFQYTVGSRAFYRLKMSF
jgi:hypothetical protein